MPDSKRPTDAAIADEPAEVVIVEHEVLGRGFRTYERVEARRADGDVETRDLLRAGAAVAVLPPRLLIELFTYLTSPGLTDEEVTVFLGIVDASDAAVPAAAEREASALLRVPIEAALAVLAAGRVRNGPLVAALQWLALNRNRLHDIARAGAVS
jgi:ADP-ribose pyrophosphatase